MHTSPQTRPGKHQQCLGCPWHGAPGSTPRLLWDSFIAAKPGTQAAWVREAGTARAVSSCICPTPCPGDHCPSGPSVPRCSPQLRALLDTGIPAQGLSRHRHILLLPLLPGKQASLLMGSAIRETNPIPFCSSFCFLCKTYLLLVLG